MNAMLVYSLLVIHRIKTEMNMPSNVTTIPVRVILMAEDRLRWETELDKFPDYKAHLAKKAAAKTQQAAEKEVKRTAKRSARPKPRPKQRVRVLPKASARPQAKRSIAPTEAKKKLRKVWLLTAASQARICCCQLLTCEEGTQAGVDDPHPVSLQARKQAVWEDATDESEEESEEEEELDLGESDSADELPSEDDDQNAGESLS